MTPRGRHVLKALQCLRLYISDRRAIRLERADRRRPSARISLEEAERRMGLG